MIDKNCNICVQRFICLMLIINITIVLLFTKKISKYCRSLTNSSFTRHFTFHFNVVCFSMPKINTLLSCPLFIPLSNNVKYIVCLLMFATHHLNNRIFEIFLTFYFVNLFRIAICILFETR